MKIYDAFDKIQDMPDNISQDTLCESTGINIQNIKNRVFSSSDFRQPKKHNISKAIFIFAAVLSSVAVISTAAASIIGFDNVFGHVFNGDMSAEKVYNGNDVKISTKDENLNVELLGIAGNENVVYTAIKLTHKDGTPFASEHSEIGLHTLTQPNDMSIDHVQVQKDFTVTLDGGKEKSNAGNTVNGTGIAGIGEWEYKRTNGFTPESDISAVRFVLEDDRQTLKIYVKYISSEVSPESGTLNISFKALSEYIPAKVLKTYSADDTAVYTDIKAFYKQGIDAEIVETSDSVQLVQMENNPLDVQFDISVGLDYLSNTKKFTFGAEDAEKLLSKDYPDNRTGITKSAEVTVSAFGVNIRGISDNNYQCHIDDSSKVILKDGTEYKLENTASISSWNDDSNENTDIINIEYFSKDDTEIWNPNTEIVILDVNEIQTVIINGVEIHMNP